MIEMFQEIEQEILDLADQRYEDVINLFLSQNSSTNLKQQLEMCLQKYVNSKLKLHKTKKVIDKGYCLLHDEEYQLRLLSKLEELVKQNKQEYRALKSRLDTNNNLYY